MCNIIETFIKVLPKKKEILSDIRKLLWDNIDSEIRNRIKQSRNRREDRIVNSKNYVLLN